MTAERSAGGAAPGEPGVALSDLVAYLNDYLRVDSVRDYGPNGLQVEGRPRVTKLATGVSACRELFVRAREMGADSVLVHHGLFWEFLPRQLTGVAYGRVAELVRAEISLLGYHLPLDRHPEVGNNAVAARRLGLAEIEPFAEHKGATIGFHGRLAEPITPDELARRCAELFGQEPQLIGGGPEAISRVGIVSGAAESSLWDAIGAGLDAFITGEPAEWVMNVAREAGIHYLAAGHYATERLGVLALGEHLAERFGLEVAFVEIPNPV